MSMWIGGTLCLTDVIVGLALALSALLGEAEGEGLLLAHPLDGRNWPKAGTRFSAVNGPLAGVLLS